MGRLLLLNKPYGALCQFTPEAGRASLADFVEVPGVYPAGRLDADSEGLVLLTDDGRLQAAIADPRHKLPKAYWVQVEGEPSAGDPPIRSRRHIPTAWLELELREGRNRQVRRMTAAVGLPTLRLVRHRIGPWNLSGLLPGEWREIAPPSPRQLLRGER